MSDPGSGGPRPTATRGLATVALLKVNFDAGRDHLSMFEPFVLDTLANTREDALGVSDVQRAIDERHQLKLPIDALRTLLGRIVKAGYLTREGGRFIRTGQEITGGDLLAERSRVEGRQRQLADAFREAATRSGATINTTEDALARILKFLEDFHVAVVLDDYGNLRPGSMSDLDDEDVVTRDVALTAQFLHDTISSGGPLVDVVQELMEGFVLQNTLLLKDISQAARQFRHLRVVCDSGLLFDALGYRGAATEQAVREFFNLLRSSGCILEVFDVTLKEMRRILAVYEDRVGTHNGRLSLHPSDMTRHFLQADATPSDIRTYATLLENNLRDLDVNVRDLPKREIDLTLDEAQLGEMLKNHAGGENDPRVIHDIDCVAGVLVLRDGQTSESWDDCGAVFVTGSLITARTIRQWYEAEKVGGMPPVIPHLQLSNLAWLKRPASASSLKLHELTALCSAALRPSRKAWSTFLRYLRDLESSGQLSGDEVIAIVASGLTDRLLVDEAVGDDCDASTLSEVVARVKASYKAEHDARVSEAETKASNAMSASAELKSQVSRRSRLVAKSVSWGIAALMCASFVVGTVLAIRGASGDSGSIGVLALVLGIGPLAIAGLASLLWGFHITAWRAQFEERVFALVHSWLAGSPPEG